MGSTGRIATDIHNLLISLGHESVIAYGRGEARNCDQTIKIGNDLDVYWHVFKTRLFDLHGFGSKRATKRFVSTITDLNPDIIHLHNIHGYYIHVEILFDYLKKVNKPVVWTFHDCWPFSGHAAYINDYEKEDGSKLKRKFAKIHSYPKSYIIDNSKNNYLNKKRIFTGVNNLTIVTPSKWLKNLVENSFLRDYEVKVINNGIDLNIFKPVTSNFRENHGIGNKFLILGVANVWEPRKGLNYFLELSKKVSEDIIIVLVGLTEKQIKGLPDNIIGISRTNNVQELAEIYSSADVFVNPTLEDNYPTTNLESLACGTPVVTFNTGGSGESVVKGCGKVVPRGDLNRLIEAINEIKTKGKENFKDSCIHYAQRNFNKEDRYKEYIRLYGEKIL